MGRKYRPVIVHVVNRLEGGGTERSLAYMLSHWRHDWLDHRIITLREAGSLATALPDQVSCFPMDVRGRSWTAWLRLAKILRSWKADLVHARNTGCWADVILASLVSPKTQFVLGFHGLESPGPMPARTASIARFALRTGTVFSVVSQAGQEKLDRELGIPAESITVLRNGVDATRFKPATPRQRLEARIELGLSDNELVIGTVGSLTTVKNQPLLLSAFASVLRQGYRAKLLIVGDGPRRPSLDNSARQLGIDKLVQFEGESNNVVGKLHAMDVYVCSSDSESLSNSLLEALATGLPVVSTAVGDHTAVLADGRCGIIVPPGDTPALARALCHLCSNAMYRQQLGCRAHVRARDFDSRDTIASYEQYYATLTRQRFATAPTAADKRLVQPSVDGPVTHEARPRVPVIG